MRHIEFIINKSFKNKFGNVYFLRFIFNNFKNKHFIGYTDFVNNVWGEKWVRINIKKILKLLNQLKALKSKSTAVFYVKQLVFGIVSFRFFVTLKFDFLSLMVQRGVLILYSTDNFIATLGSKIKNRIVNKTDLIKTEMLQDIFSLK